MTKCAGARNVVEHDRKSAFITPDTVWPLAFSSVAVASLRTQGGNAPQAPAQGRRIPKPFPAARPPKSTAVLVLLSVPLQPPLPLRRLSLEVAPTSCFKSSSCAHEDKATAAVSSYADLR